MCCDNMEVSTPQVKSVAPMQRPRITTQGVVDYLRNNMTDALRELSEEHRRLVGFARFAADNAFHMYSRAAVGAAVSTASGDVYIGANVETLSPRTHAENSVFSDADTQGERNIRAMATILRVLDHKTSQPVAIKDPPIPCGSCCQEIFEHGQLANVNIPVACANPNMDAIMVLTAKQLLPYGRGPLDFGWNYDKWRDTTWAPTPRYKLFFDGEDQAALLATVEPWI